MEAIGQGTAIFCSAPLAVMHNDVEHPFRQDSDFFYLTGFNEPAAVAVLALTKCRALFLLCVWTRMVMQTLKSAWTFSTKMYSVPVP